MSQACAIAAWKVRMRTRSNAARCFPYDCHHKHPQQGIEEGSRYAQY
jgi:hypothetical protein